MQGLAAGGVTIESSTIIATVARQLLPGTVAAQFGEVIGRQYFLEMTS